ncbi:MAG TPA: hypothetical protein VG779_08615 [Actinomycetota bacterium]|nr:hypothetical protein [Actinomycetota bacterium]
MDDSDSDMEWPSALQDLGALWLAESPEELWRALVLGGGLGASSNHWDAGLLFRHHHGDGQPGALETALLLCTDLRWRRATAGLIAEIAGSGVLDGNELAVLAKSFLNEAVIWEAPASWTEGPWIEIVLSESADGDDGLAEDDPPPGPLQVRREVRPPLRRWAAAELLRQRPERLDDVFARTQTLSARDAAAVVAGIIDASDALDQQRAQRVLEIGLGWPAGWVRLVALERLAGGHGLDAARRLAADDPDARIRQWAHKPDQKPQRAKAPGRSGPAGSEPGRRAPGTQRRESAPKDTDPGTQPSLFDL